MEVFFDMLKVALLICVACAAVIASAVVYTLYRTYW